MKELEEVEELKEVIQELEEVNEEEVNKDIIIADDVTVDENDNTDDKIENLDTNVVLKVNENNIEICEEEDDDDFDIKIEETNDDEDSNPKQKDKHEKKSEILKKLKAY